MPDMPLEGKSLDKALPDDEDPDDEPDEPGVSVPSKEGVPNVPVSLVDGNCEELVPVVSEGPSTPSADAPEASVPDEDTPAVPDAPALSVFPFAPFMNDESPCDEMPALEESPDELIPGDAPLMPPLVPEALHAVALSRHAAQANGMIHFFSIAITAPS